MLPPRAAGRHHHRTCSRRVPAGTTVVPRRLVATRGSCCPGRPSARAAITPLRRARCQRHDGRRCRQGTLLAAEANKTVISLAAQSPDPRPSLSSPAVGEASRRPCLLLINARRQAWEKVSPSSRRECSQGGSAAHQALHACRVVVSSIRLCVRACQTDLSSRSARHAAAFPSSTTPQINQKTVI